MGLFDLLSEFLVEFKKKVILFAYSKFFLSDLITYDIVSNFLSQVRF